MLPDRPDSVLVGAVRPSPNHGERAGACRPRLVILHYTGMPDGAGAIAWMCDPRSEVSAHYVVEEAGGILQLVPEARRAWHAGRSAWQGDTDINSASIGIEIVNPGHDGGLPPFPPQQIAAVIRLCRDILDRHALSPGAVLAHSDVAPGRKQDPGERFPWEALHRAGAALWLAADPAATGSSLMPGDDGAAVGALQRDLARFGFGLAETGRYDAATAAVVRSLQLRFRQARCDGVADPETRDVLARLLALTSDP